MRIPVKNITNGEVDAEGKPILRMSIHIGEGNAILNGKKYPIELLADGEGGMTFVFLEGRDLSGKREVFRVESGSVVPRLLLRPGEDPPDDDELIERAISGLNDLVEISKILGLKDNEGVIDGTLRLVGERAELREQVAELLPEADAKQHFATRALRAEKRINMAREALEAIANMPWGGAPRDLLKELQVVSEALNGPMVLGQPEPRSSDAEPSGQECVTYYCHACGRELLGITRCECSVTTSSSDASHAAHCCPLHGCKYSSDEPSSCPVVLKRIEREPRAGWCQEPDLVDDPEACRREDGT